MCVGQKRGREGATWYIRVCKIEWVVNSCIQEKEIIGHPLVSWLSGENFPYPLMTKSLKMKILKNFYKKKKEKKKSTINY